MPLQHANLSAACDARTHPFMNTHSWINAHTYNQALCAHYVTCKNKTCWFLHFKQEHLSFGLSYLNVLINAYMAIKSTNLYACMFITEKW